jgi:FMN phosphatase YigB (HAD superfamily)
VQARFGDERLRRDHREKIDRLGFRTMMDAFFLADEVRMVKPDPELFRHACRVLVSEPARTRPGSSPS